MPVATACSWLTNFGNLNSRANHLMNRKSEEELISTKIFWNLKKWVVSPFLKTLSNQIFFAFAKTKEEFCMVNSGDSWDSNSKIIHAVKVWNS